MCLEKGCTTSPTFGTKPKNPEYCKKHKKEGMVDVLNIDKHCLEKDCTTIANFGTELKKPKYCFKHKKEGMSNVRNKQCIEKDCTTRPTYGTEPKKALYCTKHKKEGMDNVLDKKCKEKGCKVNRLYGTEWSKPEYCFSHKKEGMTNVVSTQCLEEGCTTRPVFGIKRGTPALYCNKHKKEGVINVLCRLCSEKGCTTQPNYGLEYGKVLYCSKHKKEEMFDVKQKYHCLEEECKIKPTYGIVWNRPLYCKKHAKKDMVDVKNKSCKIKSCMSRPVYGDYENGLTHCTKHANKTSEWKITNCINDICRNTSIWSKSGNYPYEYCDVCVPFEGYNSQLAGKCISCSLPDLLLDEDKKCLLSCTELHKERQKYSENEMLKKFEKKKWKFTTDKTVSESGCSLRRPDFIFDFGSMILIVENDENQHKSRPCECEQTRMIQLYQDHGGLPVHFIRFNPDRYKSDKTIEPLPKRLNNLCDIISKIKKDKDFFLRNPHLTVSYLYYDGWDGIWNVDNIKYD
jgi:hypothetical protein